MFQKFGLASLLAVMAFALLTTGCNGGVSVGVGVGVYEPYNPYYYDPYYGWIIYDDYYDPYYDCYYCYSDDGGLTQKDLAKMTADKQAEVIGRSAGKIQSTLGLSAERSTDIAKIAFQMAKAPKGSLTVADYDNFTKQVLGSTAKEVQSALTKSAQGDNAALEQLIDRAAAANGIGPEHAREIMKMMN